jgi:signal transduction histidine kinase
MAVAMKNERFAVRQKLTDIYRTQLVTSHARLSNFWQHTAIELEKLTLDTPAPAAFAKCVRAGGVDAVVLFDEQGRVAYPRSPLPLAVSSEWGEFDRLWADAGQLEFLKRNYQAAADIYGKLANVTSNVVLAARALQAQARCLVQEGQTNAAVQLIADVLGRDAFRQTADAQGRLIVANAELMALEILPASGSEMFETIAQRLQKRLLDYDNPALAAPQRRFLLKELHTLFPRGTEMGILAAEDIAAEIREAQPNLSRIRGIQRTVLPDVWQFVSPNRRVLALLRTESLMATTKGALAGGDLAGTQVALVAPDVDRPDAFLTLPVGEWMPGWRLALFQDESELFDSAGGSRTAIYLWTGILVVGVVTVLTVVVLRLVRRQITLARLKNDLTATVSHELRTPLSSMRVLVDTLLDGETLEEGKTREYLQLIAQENERLAWLIQNFLSFSRMERKKYAFHFVPLAPAQAVEEAIKAVRGRFQEPDCCLDVHVDKNLPSIMADSNALTTALINLLENAYKYSNHTRRLISVHVHLVGNEVVFRVRDNGIGIAQRERRKIFQPFYQVDHRLSRHGSGCGLGLSIVENITRAHGGKVSLESEPGGGSTFAISIPVAPHAVEPRRAAVV